MPLPSPGPACCAGQKLMEAIDEDERLADWVQQNDDAIWEWRRRVGAAKG
jgi:hypothetical protein